MKPLWIFGYGSLIWRPNFPHRRTFQGSIDGFVRRFWQGSPDHRGTPQSPGRVVTLHRQRGGTCHGQAYEAEPGSADEILARLDHREQAGYERTEVTVRPADPSLPEVQALVYWAGPDNPNFLGASPVDEMAQHIARSHGPSGANLEYLLRLDEALKGMGIVDEHVAQLADYARKLEC